MTPSGSACTRLSESTADTSPATSKDEEEGVEVDVSERGTVVAAAAAAGSKPAAEAARGSALTAAAVEGSAAMIGEY